MNDVDIIFPAHACDLTLEHNSHKANYESVQDFLDKIEDFYEWESVAARDKSICNDEIWTTQWYPLTPNSFYACAAPTLQGVLALALIIEKRHKASRGIE